MSKIKALILEDKISAVLDYELILDKLDVEVQGVYKTWTGIMDGLRKNPPDFMIVDLFLDDSENGMDFIKEVRNLFIPTFICTGYPEASFMEEAMEYGVKSFFTKPIDKAAFTYQVKQLIQEISNESNAQNYLLTKSRGVIVKVPFNKIYKIEIDGNYAYIFTNKGQKFILKLSLNKLMEKLDPIIFYRCHRSTVVNLNFIEKLDVANNKLSMKNGDVLNLGNKFKAPIKKVFLST